MKVAVKRSPCGAATVYEIEKKDGESVLNVLERIGDTLDPTLAFDASCRTGKCGVCRMKIDGAPKLACTEPAAGDMTLEAADGGRLVRDLLVIDVDHLYK